ncbi:MAG: hypothetical protein KAG18_06895, partial [Sinobacterium sp.]|nr:hypothetical protein [Sinobacterium sp.]
MVLIIYFQEMWQLAIQGEAQGIWFWASLYAAMLCVYSLIFKISTRYWPFVQGELSEINIERKNESTQKSTGSGLTFDILLGLRHRYITLKRSRYGKT